MVNFCFVIFLVSWLQRLWCQCLFEGAGGGCTLASGASLTAVVLGRDKLNFLVCARDGIYDKNNNLPQLELRSS